VSPVNDRQVTWCGSCSASVDLLALVRTSIVPAWRLSHQFSLTSKATWEDLGLGIGCHFQTGQEARAQAFQRHPKASDVYPPKSIRNTGLGAVTQHQAELNEDLHARQRWYEAEQQYEGTLTHVLMRRLATAPNRPNLARLSNRSLNMSELGRHSPALPRHEIVLIRGFMRHPYRSHLASPPARPTGLESRWAD
jgi:hypothetical protein